MSIHFRPTLAEINLTALRDNVKIAIEKTGSHTKIMGIVKANAYGHGAVMCARALKAQGVTLLGVATLEEGMELRNSGIQGEIVILNGLLSESLNEFNEFRLKPVLHQMDDIVRLGAFLKQSSKKMAVHLKIDTGMGRLGFLPSQVEEMVETLKKNSAITVDAVLTHLARADEDNSEPTDRQYLLFSRLQNILKEKGLDVPVYHIANSAALLTRPIESYELARPGIMLYGAYPNASMRDKAALKPVMTLKTKILSLKNMPAGHGISYGATFTTARESLIAVLPIGYADGYPRLASNKACVLIAGKRVPLVGRVCMDLCMADVTDVPGVKIGDEVVLMGKQGNEWIRAEEIAAWAETISYEIFCGISSRVPRIYLGM
ncbi:alanine racemase [bacterium]|nr:alanine racemase [bacterium]